MTCFSATICKKTFKVVGVPLMFEMLNYVITVGIIIKWTKNKLNVQENVQVSNHKYGKLS